MRKYYSSVRTLHLYFGLFISPLVLIFSLSVFVFNHTQILDQIRPVKALPSTRTKLKEIPQDSTDLLVAKAILRNLNITGEIDFISRSPNRITFPVNKPGLRMRVEVNTDNDSVLITRENTGALRGMSYLHIMPGQHNVKMRGNSGYMKVWRLLADGVVYVLLFLSVSGVFLWYFLRMERSAGLISLTIGALIFVGLLILMF